jgi:hypothetical protein
MPMKGITTGEDLYEKVQKVLRSLDSPIQKLERLVIYGAPSMARGNHGVLLHITSMKNITDHNLIISQCLTDQEIPQNTECCYSGFEGH